MTTTLAVNEIFESVQGEATFTGTPAVFVRLQGCAVGCPWCDTKHTWGLDQANEFGLATVLTKVEDSPLYARLSAEKLAQVIQGYDAGHVVITGGEPCTYDLTELTELLSHMGRSVQVETSGTSPVRVSGKAWVTLSPKLDMPGGLKVLSEAVGRADEIKMPVGRQRDVDRLLAFVDEHHIGIERPVWLQPLSMSKKATALCVEAATLFGWRVSVQTHKLLGVR